MGFDSSFILSNWSVLVPYIVSQIIVSRSVRSPFVGFGDKSSVDRR